MFNDCLIDTQLEIISVNRALLLDIHIRVLIKTPFRNATYF